MERHTFRSCYIEISRVLDLLCIAKRRSWRSKKTFRDKHRHIRPCSLLIWLTSFQGVTYKTSKLSCCHIQWKVPEACVNACLVQSNETVSKMYLVLSVTVLVFSSIYGVACVTLTHSSLGDHLIISIKSEHRPFPLLSHFPWLCAWGCCTIICFQFHIYVSWKSWVMLLLLLCSLMMSANNQVHYGPMVVIFRLHIQLPHYHNLKWSWGAYCRVCMRLSQFSQLSSLR